MTLKTLNTFIAFFAIRDFTTIDEMAAPAERCIHTVKKPVGCKTAIIISPYINPIDVYTISTLLSQDSRNWNRLLHEFIFVKKGHNYDTFYTKRVSFSIYPSAFKMQIIIPNLAIILS